MSSLTSETASSTTPASPPAATAAVPVSGHVLSTVTSQKRELYSRDRVLIRGESGQASVFSGRLALVHHSAVDPVSLSWTPDASAISSPGQTYAIHVPVAEIVAVKRNVPALRDASIVVCLGGGIAFPEMVFSNGGIGEFFNALGRVVALAPSPGDRNTLLVSPLRDIMADPASADGGSGSNSSGSNSANASGGSSSSASSGSGNNMLKEATWGLFSGFSKVTKLARDTTSMLFSQQKDAPYADPVTPLVISSGKKSRLGGGKDAIAAAHDLNVQQAMQAGMGQAQVGAAASVGPYPSKEELYELRSTMINWAALDECAAAAAGAGSASASGSSGSPALQQLGASPGSPSPKSPAPLQDRSGDRVLLPHREQPVSPDEWFTWVSRDGGFRSQRDYDMLRRRAFFGGLDPSLRGEAWSIFTGYLDPRSTYEERARLRQDKLKEYAALKLQWTSISEKQELRFSEFRDRRHRIEKDVLRTDRTVPYFAGADNPHLKMLFDILLTYSFYNYDLGYCQGMSDMLAPILFVLQNEEDAFWAFASLMERMETYFQRDQAGINRHLGYLRSIVQVTDRELYTFLSLKSKDSLNFFFAFRWVLLWFKREFSFDEVLVLWDSLLCRYLSDDFHLFIAAAVFSKYRREIINNRMGFDDIIKLANSLSGNLDLPEALLLGEKCLYDLAAVLRDLNSPGGTASQQPNSEGATIASTNDDGASLTSL